MFRCHMGGAFRTSRLAGYEITEAVIRVQERVRPTINNVEAVIERIRFSHATRKYRYPAILGREMIGQSVLAKWRA